MLSPSDRDKDTNLDFSNPEVIYFGTLGEVLSGNGIPDALRVSLDPVRLPRQTVNEFPLGVDFGSIEGKYEFIAPLQFNNGARVVYSDTISGWSSDDLDAITIEQLNVSLDITTNLPISCTLTGYPIDVYGNRINGVEIKGSNIDANADSQHIDIFITGQITRLDGIEFIATAYASGDKRPLTPDQYIKLDNIRPRVTGYYEKDL